MDLKMYFQSRSLNFLCIARFTCGRLSAHNSKGCILAPGCSAFCTYVLMSKIIYSRAGRPRPYGTDVTSNIKHPQSD